ncbi:MAG: class I SAM-dependent methyltransferase [Ignavibacteriales bacterium]
MPSSYFYPIPTIVQFMCSANPKSILDIGFGFGKYGFLAREYLEIWLNRYHSSEWQIKIDGIEIFEPYITDIQRCIYNNIFIGEALTIMRAMSNETYDLIIATDILEHFEKVDGIQFLQECKRIAKKALISTPKNFHPQQTVFGNEHEKHKSHWTKEELLELGAKDILPDGSSILAVFKND